MSSNIWYCYLLIGVTGRHTYIGATTDVNRRLRQHNGELCSGAKRTRANRPWRVLAYVEVGEKIPALQLEWRIKRARGVKNRLDKFVELSQDRELTAIINEF
jgi:predicted GIY-YIG superfamily endonuclease